MIEGRYPVTRSTGRCAARDTELAAGSACMATLCDAGEEGLKRLDYSLEAWQEGIRPEGLFSFWKTTVPEEGTQKKQIIDESVLLTIFEQLAEDEQPRRVSLRFVLALILMRKRLLRFMGRVEEDGVVTWQMKPRGATPESPLVDVVDPGLGDEDVLALSEQLAEVLESDL